MRQFSSQTVTEIIKLSAEPSVTRGALARRLCELDDWIDSQGRLAVSSARKALVTLSAKANFTLPEAQGSIPDMVVDALPPPGLEELRSVRCRLSELGEITVDIACDRHQRRSWDAMMESFHPLGFKRPPGAQIRYWIRSSRFGVIGGIAFSAASWHQKARDEFIGWDNDTRAQNLSKLICNHRFLLIPRIYGLASKVLQLTCARVGRDWSAQYQVTPAMAYTYVEPCYSGASYQAAGWQRCLNLSSGMPRRGHAPVTQKSIWMQPLSDNWQADLCTVMRRAIVQPKAVYLNKRAHWAEREYARSSHPDGRVRARIIEMGKTWVDHHGKSIPTMFVNRAARKAAYRLLSSDQVSMEHILEPHQASVAERCAAEKVVLAIQDTTSLNYHGLSTTEGLVGIGGRGKGAQGVLAHFGLAVNAVGRPLGVYTLDAGFRKVSNTAQEGTEELAKESARWLAGLHRAQELSDACCDTRVVTVCDREADLWLLIRAAVDKGAGLLVRSNRARKRRVILDDGRCEKLSEHMHSQQVIAHKTIRVAACGGTRKRQGRKVRLELRAAMVTLKAPVAATDQRPVKMLAVSVDEAGSVPAGQKPLHWLLLSTEGAADGESARQAVRWYEMRWHIETWFSVLKNCTSISTRQFDHADDLRKALVFDAITACFVHDLVSLARNSPDEPAVLLMGADLVRHLYRYLYARGVYRSRAPPNYSPTMRTFVIDLASLAGFESRKSQPLPGTRKVWQAFELFTPALIAYRDIDAQK